MRSVDVEALRKRVAGEVVARADGDYETRRREMVWNALTPDGRPEIVVRVAGEPDVVAAIRFAREAGLGVAVRGGGHHWSGVCLSDATLLLDLSQLAAVEVDVAAQRAWVEPGVENRALARRLGEVGLAFPYGHCGSVKVSGYLLSGGLGWNPGAWGPACANVEAVRVITADGRTVEADESHEPDLFWAARGAGAGFFAVATRFRLKLHALPRCIRTATLVYPASRLVDVAAWAEAAAPQLTAAVELGVFLAAAPPDLAAGCSGDNGMACLVMATAFAESEREVSSLLAPIGAAPTGALANVPPADTPFEALFGGVEQLFAENQRWLVDTFVLPAPRERMPAFARLFTASPSPRSTAVVSFGNPAVRCGALALPAGAYVFPYATWTDARDDDANRRWFDQVVALLEPGAAGHYVGEADLNRPGRAERCFRTADWQRLEELRRRWDPERVFAGFPRS